MFFRIQYEFMSFISSTNPNRNTFSIFYISSIVRDFSGSFPVEKEKIFMSLGHTHAIY